MQSKLRAVAGGFVVEVQHLKRSPAFVLLVVVQAVTFLFLVSLFGLTGSRAPTAVIFEDNGPYAQLFYRTLDSTRNSFSLRQMNRPAAVRALRRGEIVAIITIPSNFTESVTHGKNVLLKVEVDNVNTDMTEDVERAIPSAIVSFGRQLDLPAIRVHLDEIDLVDHDTGFIAYLVVSGLVLDAFVIACILSATTLTREFEAGTVDYLGVAPVRPIFPVMGRVLATVVVACLAMAIPLAVVVFGYRIVPVHPFQAVAAIVGCVVCFSCVGLALGTAVKRTMPVVSLIFGLVFPLYICSGSLEPERFDGNKLWLIGHCSPVYYAVGVLQDAFHGLRVMPESSETGVAALVAWTIAMALLAGAGLYRSLRRT